MERHVFSLPLFNLLLFNLLLFELLLCEPLILNVLLFKSLLSLAEVLSKFSCHPIVVIKMNQPQEASVFRRLGRKASGFLRRQMSMSNLCAAAQSTNIPANSIKVKRLRRRPTLHCLKESPGSSPEPRNTRLTIANQTRVLRKAKSEYQFIGPVTLEEGSSIADYDSIADDNRKWVKRAENKVYG